MTRQAEAVVVRRIFEAYAAGASLTSLVTALNKEGILSPRGLLWSKNLLHNVLRNERYIGVTIWNRREWYTDAKTEQRRYRKRPESE